MIAAGDIGTASRPLRALTLTLLVYGAGRATVVLLSPSGEPHATASAIAARAAVRPMPSDMMASGMMPAEMVTARVLLAEARSPTRRATRASVLEPEPVSLPLSPAAGDTGAYEAMTARPKQMLEPEEQARAALLPSVLAPAGDAERRDWGASRWSGSFYAVTRGAGPAGSGPALGGTQAGLRVYRRVARDLAVTASLAASPGGQGTREATIGLALRHGPVGVIAERALPVGAATPGFRILGYAGIARPVAAGWQLDGYGQAGITRIGGFADAALALERPVLRRGEVEVTAGVGGWGSAQKDARRVDVGPQLVARLPIGTRRMRLSAEWRLRIAGNARPASGPSVTLGADF